jgi:hypothetical protein
LYTETNNFSDRTEGKIYDENYNLIVAFAVDSKGKLSVIDTENGRVLDYGENVSDCFDQFHTFTGNSLIDAGISGIFNAATLGLYSPVVGAACLGAGTAMK